MSSIKKHTIKRVLAAIQLNDWKPGRKIQKKNLKESLRNKFFSIVRTLTDLNRKQILHNSKGTSTENQE